MKGATCGEGNVYPSGAPDFTSDFNIGSCCPVTCISCSLFHVIVLAFGFCVLIYPLVGMLVISILFSLDCFVQFLCFETWF